MSQMTCNGNPPPNGPQTAIILNREMRMMETPASNLRRALQCRNTSGQIPLWELEFHLFDAFAKSRLILGYEFERLSGIEKEKALHANAEIIASVSRELGFSGVTVPTGYWNQAPGQLAYFVLPEEYRFRQAEILRQRLGDEILMIVNVRGVIGADYDEDFCAKLFETPEEIDDMASAVLRQGLIDAKKMRDVGAGAVFTASDMADNSGPFFSPPQMDRFILPYLDEWAEKVKDMGLLSISQSDGNLTNYLERIAATSVDALQAIDPTAGMDIAQARDMVGDRLCLCGNVDCGLLVAGRPEEVHASTLRLLHTMQDSQGFVLGASNAVQLEVRPDNYRAIGMTLHHSLNLNSPVEAQSSSVFATAKASNGC